MLLQAWYIRIDYWNRSTIACSAYWQWQTRIKRATECMIIILLRDFLSLIALIINGRVLRDCIRLVFFHWLIIGFMYIHRIEHIKRRSGTKRTWICNQLDGSTTIHHFIVNLLTVDRAWNLIILLLTALIQKMAGSRNSVVNLIFQLICWNCTGSLQSKQRLSISSLFYDFVNTHLRLLHW